MDQHEVAFVPEQGRDSALPIGPTLHCSELGDGLVRDFLTAGGGERFPLLPFNTQHLVQNPGALNRQWDRGQTDFRRALRLFHFGSVH